MVTVFWLDCRVPTLHSAASVVVTSAATVTFGASAVALQESPSLWSAQLSLLRLLLLPLLLLSPLWLLCPLLAILVAAAVTLVTVASLVTVAVIAAVASFLAVVASVGV